ncbi:hypothetical protein [Pseudozobellia sp. WGM2]|uniref:hypothetical protein n=1 Tax=Pseudozobellia sp. WGM2 TaxID=2787625 RepID=UPI001ADFC15C|nr:hypothetical protein [Pseudozobellia sp. WGM2]
MRTIKKIKLFFFVYVAGIGLLTQGCQKDNPLSPAGNCFGGNWAQGYADELQAWSNAATAYSENPSSKNCAEYKNAAKGYLDALDNIYDCVPTTNRAEIDQAIKEAKTEIDSESCG